MQTTSELLVSLGFPAKPFGVLSRFAIADLVRPGERCGIYVLHFTDGDFYVGQSKDVTKRFVHHRRGYSHDDIDSLYFKQVAEPSLDGEEAKIVVKLKAANVKLRNILLGPWKGGEADFDEIMPLEEQERWLADLSLSGDADFKRLVDDELRSKYRRRFERFQAHPQHEQVVEILREYVKFGIPAARRGEVSFWSVSCWPSKGLFARLNLFWQEVLSIYATEGGSTVVSFHMADSPFVQLSDVEHNEYVTRCLRDLTMHGLLSASRVKDFCLAGGSGKNGCILDQLLVELVRVASATVRVVLAESRAQKIEGIARGMKSHE